MGDTADANLLSLTVQIVAAYAEHNEIAADALAQLIRSVYRSMATVAALQVNEAEAPIPAVPVKRSVFPNYLICLEDGRKLKMLKRHLDVSCGMSLEDYRTKWKLPPDYPMVAPDYKATRSALAKAIGLGRKLDITVGPEKAAETEEPS